MSRSAPGRHLERRNRGDFARSVHWDALLRHGGVGDELRAALACDGVCWGAITLYRERARPRFSAEEGAFVRDVLALLAEGIRRG